MKLSRYILVIFTFLIASTCWSSNVTEDELDIDFVGDLDIPEPSNTDEYSLRGFIDTRWGTRYRHTEFFSEQNTLSEIRVQGQLKFNWNSFKFNIKGDLINDQVINETEMDWREIYIDVPENEYFSLRVGRQNITWGFGDLLVVNDLFPKDFQSLYISRDPEAEYMVKSSDGIRSSFFINKSSVDVIVVKHEPNTIPTGKRNSFYNPFLGEITGEEGALNIQESEDWVLMTRFNTKIWGNEFALFYADTRSNLPEGFDTISGTNFYPEFKTYGLNMRGEVGSGILAYDGAYFESSEDREGTNPLIPNSSYRHILAYDIELAPELNMGLQWYYENRKDQSAYEASFLGPEAEPEAYNLLTLRLNQMLLSQKMTLSFFVFHSPTDDDTYYRFNIFHKFDDQWMINIGSNYFTGKNSGRFGQLQHNSNYFAALRWSF